VTSNVSRKASLFALRADGLAESAEVDELEG
jgi:hypothetical protein